MQILKRFTGIVWILLGAGVVGLAVWRAIFELGTNSSTDSLVFWIIVLAVLVPIIGASLILFGWFALQNEYEEIPT